MKKSSKKDQSLKKMIRSLVNPFSVEKQSEVHQEVKKEKKVENPNLQLADLFESPKKLGYILDLFVKRRLIPPGSTLYIDKNKANLIRYVRELQFQHYFKQVKLITNLQIQLICLNTFGILISESYIKKTTYVQGLVTFIPNAYSIGI